MFRSVKTAVGFSLLMTAAASAQDRNWATASSGNWNTASNWSPADVPDTVAESAAMSIAGTYTVTLDTSPTILGLSIGNAGATLDMPAGRTLSLTDTASTNNGLIRINTTGGGAGTSLSFNNTAGLSGSGEIRLNGSSSFAQLNTGMGATLTQPAAHRITGRGQLNATLVNNGLVSADQNGTTLLLQTNLKTNNGTMEATGGGTLQVSTDIAQGGSGLIRANGGDVNLSGIFSITGGSLGSISGTFVRNSGSTGTLASVTNNAPVTLNTGTSLAISGTGIVNNGQVVVNTTGGAPRRFSTSTPATSTEPAKSASTAIRVSPNSIRPGA